LLTTIEEDLLLATVAFEAIRTCRISSNNLHVTQQAVYSFFPRARFER
jgi:hypothetical protein